MDIRHLARHHQSLAVQSGSTGSTTAAQSTTATAEPTSAGTAASSTTEGPAARSHFSRAGRLLNVLQSFEQRHPEETKAILNNIADKLRSDAEQAGPFGARLSKWADRFQQAADSGDMSKLMPRELAGGHFGMRAYQQAQQATETESEAEAMVAQVADAALTQANGAGTFASAAASGVSVVPEGSKPSRVETVSESATAQGAAIAEVAESVGTREGQAPGDATAAPSSIGANITAKL